MGKRMLSLCMALALCLGLLPATALATGGDWEHNDHTGWTELTAEELSKKNYTLEDGKYYLSSKDRGMLQNQFLMYNMPEPITVTGTVTLCLNNVSYTYTGSEQSAIVVQKGASLTICGCAKNGNNYLGSIFSNSVLYTVSNSGTLHITSGGISSSVESGAAIYNAGTCTISGGKVSGSAGNAYDGYKTAYGVYNAGDGNLTITGSPEISGQEPDDPKGPQIDVYTSDTITVHDLSAEFEGINIGFYGEDGATVVSGVTKETAELFKVTDPANSELNYNAEDSSLTFKKGEVIDYGSLYFAGEPVVNNTEYKINYAQNDSTFSVSLEEVTADSDDYDLLWNEQERTLTLNSATAKASCEYSSAGQDNWDALISLSCEEKTTLTINVIGKNNLTALNPFSGWSSVEDSRVIENLNGDIIFTGDGSLTVEVVADKYTYDEESGFNVESMTAIYATGAVENQTNLTVTSTDEDKICQSMTGIACASFTNTGAFTAKISDASTACALSTGDFTNSGILDVDFTGVDNGVGVLLAGDGSSFTNSGKMDIDIPAADRAQGILRYSAPGEAAEDNFTWTNTAGGSITIQVGNQGAATAALGGGSLAGLDLRSDGDITFTNKGDLTVDATSDEPANLSQTNWPSWQYFDTIALGLMPGGTGTVTNTGSMALAAYNGYTAGLYVAGVEDTVSITNSGELNITTTTKGGDNIRSVGLYAQLMQITETEAQQLPFDTTGGKVTISTTAAEGSQVDSDKLMAICLVQTFDETAPEASDDFQQIEEEGIALSGEAVVYKDGNSMINTIGTVDENGNVTPSTGMTALPALTGNVTIEGNPQVGDTLTAQVSGLPGGVTVAYQWQSADSQSGPFTAIDGATGESYTLTNSELGKYIRVVVTPTGDSYGGTLTATTSQPVARPYSPPANPNYKITIEDTEHGAVTAPTSAKQGTEVTLTPTPDEGFDVGTVTVTDRFGDAVAVTENPDGTYTFTMPNGQVTVEVTFVESQPEPLPFTDVAESDWFYDAVRYAYENGLMGGVGDNLFAPNNPTTRAQLVTILYRLEGEPAVTGQSPFTDVEADTWYTDAVTWAAEEGVVNGVSATQFAPGNNITREQLATILFRYAQAKGYDVSPRADLSGFPDAGDILPYAQEAMAWAVAEGLLQGFEDDTLRPQGNATRAQIATILMRFCEGVVE